jgi:hypothetical protein
VVVIVVGLCGCSFSPNIGVVGDGDVPPVPDVAAPTCDAPASFDAGLTPSSTIYVSPLGSVSPDGSADKPFGSIGAALVGRAPGTRIELLPGTYPGELISDLHGTATAPFWIEGATTGGRAQLTSLLRFSGPQYVAVRHLDVVSASRALTFDDNGVRTAGIAHHIAVEDVAVSGPAGVGDCLQLTGVDDASFDRVRSTGCRVGFRVSGTHRAVLSHLQVTTTTLAGIAVQSGSNQIDIRQSTFTNNGQRAVWIGGSSSEDEFRPPLAMPADNYEASDVHVFDNLITGSGLEAIPCSLCQDSLVAHNLIRGTWTEIGHLIAEHGPINGHAFVQSGSMTWINNAIEVTSNATPMVADGGTDPASCVYSHNLWDGTMMPASGEPGMIYNMPSGYDAAGQLCTGAAAHAGVLVPEAPGTFDGECRAMPPSIGPDEPAAGC